MILAAERLEALESAVAELAETNERMPVIVEGKRDIRALRRLGLRGEILMVNTGDPLIDFCDRLAEREDEAVLLTDWDRTGGAIARKLRDNVQGRVKLEDGLRRRLSFYSEVSAVEELPGYMVTLRKRVLGEPRREGRPDAAG